MEDWRETPHIPKFLGCNGNLLYQLKSIDKTTKEEVTLTSNNIDGNVIDKETNLPLINKTVNSQNRQDI